MASIGNPKTWIPYMQTNDCSQGFCNEHCLQWCNLILPPPPPSYEFPNDNPGPNFSPLVIAIIGILASAFLLVSYYTVISKYCGKSNSSEDHNVQFEENIHNPSLHEPWQVDNIGLDEALIKSITSCKFKKGDGLIEGTDCSVCLSEFKEDEIIRLLPKCSHAFHVECIDMWLKSHSNCPMCRAGIISIGVNLPCTESNEVEGNENAISSSDSERNNGEETMHSVIRGVPKSPLRILEERHTVIEIRDEWYMRRSFSMDHSRILVSDLLRMDDDDDIIQLDHESDAGSSKQNAGASDKFNRSKRVLQCVLSPVAMKRSFSSGRFSLTRQGRVQKTDIRVLSETICSRRSKLD